MELGLKTLLHPVYKLIFYSELFLTWLYTSNDLKKPLVDLNILKLGWACIAMRKKETLETISV